MVEIKILYSATQADVDSYLSQGWVIAQIVGNATWLSRPI